MSIQHPFVDDGASKSQCREPIRSILVQMGAWFPTPKQHQGTAKGPHSEAAVAVVSVGAAVSKPICSCPTEAHCLVEDFGRSFAATAISGSPRAASHLGQSPFFPQGFGEQVSPLLSLGRGGRHPRYVASCESVRLSASPSLTPDQGDPKPKQLAAHPLPRLSLLSGTNQLQSFSRLLCGGASLMGGGAPRGLLSISLSLSFQALNASCPPAPTPFPFSAGARKERGREAGGSFNNSPSQWRVAALGKGAERREGRSEGGGEEKG